ncbi:hypothetical protein DNHGIG_34460 [Collibacillus ludicampi]|uniref:Uncharacterized protein n=1 Tax=Collibacillus ludicampi TaxID=2771369 RepID=A0AAV4LJ43_9BACL|nr:hypothetical protein [Collibacillus ludicampi]GIM47897.1 hypothetical protein DNHGIG_34460 [Collibacillus ludicampi]
MSDCIPLFKRVDLMIAYYILKVKKEGAQMTEQDTYILTYELEDGRQVAARFLDINDRDGCDISLGMYRMNLGPITEEVWIRIVHKFNGELL